MERRTDSITAEKRLIMLQNRESFSLIFNNIVSNLLQKICTSINFSFLATWAKWRHTYCPFVSMANTKRIRWKSYIYKNNDKLSQGNLKDK